MGDTVDLLNLNQFSISVKTSSLFIPTQIASVPAHAGRCWHPVLPGFFGRAL